MNGTERIEALRKALSIAEEAKAICFDLKSKGNLCNATQPDPDAALGEAVRALKTLLSK